MPEDIYGKNIVVRPDPLARSETFVLTTNGGQVSLAQNVNVNYNQALQRVFELGSFDIYMASGRTAGTLQIGRILGGPGLNLRQILGDDFYIVDGSQGGVMTFTDTNTGNRIVCSGCYATSESIGADANGITVVESVNIEFQSMSING